MELAGSIEEAQTSRQSPAGACLGSRWQSAELTAKTCEVETCGAFSTELRAIAPGVLCALTWTQQTSRPCNCRQCGRLESLQAKAAAKALEPTKGGRSSGWVAVSRCKDRKSGAIVRDVATHPEDRLLCRLRLALQVHRSSSPDGEYCIEPADISAKGDIQRRKRCDTCCKQCRAPKGVLQKQLSNLTWFAGSKLMEGSSLYVTGGIICLGNNDAGARC